MEEQLMRLGLTPEQAQEVAEYLEQCYGDLDELAKEAEELRKDPSRSTMRKLQGDYDDLKRRYDGDMESMNQKLSQSNLTHAVEKELLRKGAKNATAAMALVDMEQVTMKNGKLMGLEEQLQDIMAEEPYLFAQEKKRGYYPMGGKTQKDGDLQKKIYRGLRGE